LYVEHAALPVTTNFDKVVIVDIMSPRDEWTRLAHGYQVDARIVLAESKDVLKVAARRCFATARIGRCL
jgi:hypothetical protein